MKSTSFLWLAGAVALAPPALADDFAWRGRLAPGQTLEVKGVNGGITAEATGGEAEVTAVKRARHSDPDSVEIKAVEHAGGVTICAVYPGRGGGHGGCEPGEHGGGNTRNNDVQVEFTVKVPAGVKLEAGTVNGGIRVRAVESDVEASSVNGTINVEATGVVKAETVNGSIEASMGRADWNGRLDFETVNGSITPDLPADFSADVNAQTVNGRISSDFPLGGNLRQTKRTLRGTIGSGGRALELETVNGSISLRRR
jgi:DUF4097 and DUF4098 domain-containing protein YvlB